MNIYMETKKIAEAFTAEMTERAKEAVEAIIDEIPVEELREAHTEWGDIGELVNDYVDSSNAFYESFYGFDTYYAETAGRGDTGLVSLAMREMLEEEDLEYLLEGNERLDELEGLHRANYLVNLAAEALCSSFLWKVDVELIAIASMESRL